MNEANIKPDEWLAGHMRRPCYAVSIDTALIARGVPSLLTSWPAAPAFIYAKVATDDIAGVRFLQAASFYVVDCAVTFRRPVAATPAADRARHTVRLAAPDDKEATVDVARRSFSWSRFHLDPAVPKDLADELRARWVENYFLGKRGEAMLVALDGDRIIGFNQLLRRGDDYVIDLIAVDDRYRNRGVASDLIRGGDQHFADLANARVSTQVANVGACRLYERLGFVLESSQYVFHLHTGGEAG